MSKNIFIEANNCRDTRNLDDFIKKNIELFDRLNNGEFEQIKNLEDSIKEFILRKASYLDSLPYTEDAHHNRAFLTILFDLCARFYLRTEQTFIYSILEQKKLSIGSRLEATILYTHNIESNDTLINRYSDICGKIEHSFLFEDDDDSAAIVTFLKYLAVVSRGTQFYPQYAQKLKVKINESIKKNEYVFLRHSIINDVLNIDFGNGETAYKKIEEIVEKLLLKTEKNVVKKDKEIPKLQANSIYIEKLKNTVANFDEIRRISIELSDKTSANDLRGVKILETEEELFKYMKSYGKMHKAKIVEAYNLLPSSFDNCVSVVDWGCGQGIGIMLFLEKYKEVMIEKVFLIEPSIIALERAVLHTKKYRNDVKICTVNKKLDYIHADNIAEVNSKQHVQIFSNVLDLADYDLSKLTSLLIKKFKGINYFVCVSPNINEIKNQRLENFRNFFEKNYRDSYELLDYSISRKDLTDDFWMCRNSSAVGIAKHGKHHDCYRDFSENGGCFNKWTKISIVFRVEL